MLLQKLKKITLWLIISILLLYASVSFILSNINFAHSKIEHFLSEQLQTNINFGQIKGKLTFINPHFTFDKIVIYENNYDTAIQKIDALEVTFSLISSIIFRTPVIKSINIDHAVFNFITKDSSPVFTKAKNLSVSVRSLLNKLFFVHRFHFENVAIKFHNKQTKIDNTITIENLKAWKKTDSMVIQSRLLLGSSAVTLHGNIDHNKNTPEQISANVDLYAHSLVLTPWVNLLSPTKITNLSVQDFAVTTKIALSEKEKNWSLTSRFNLPEMNLSVNKHRVLTQQMKGEINVDGDSLQQWSAQLNLAEFSINKAEYPSSTISVIRSINDDKAAKLQIAVPKTNITVLKNALLASHLLSEKSQSILKTLNPEGNLGKTVIEFFPQQENFNFNVDAEFHNVSVNAWRGAPSGKNISGRIIMDRHKGVIDIDSKDVMLNLQHIFSEAWHYDTVKGRLNWKITPETYTLFTPEVITTTSALHELGHDNAPVISNGRVNLRLDISLERKVPVLMKLKVNVDKLDTQSAKKYLPTGVLSPHLGKWIQQNITSGYVSDTTFSWNSPIEGLTQKNLKWGLDFNIAQAKIDYSNDWPEITSLDAAVHIDQRSLHIAHASGVIYDSKVNDINVSIEDFIHPVLQLSAQSKISGKDTLTIFRTSPVNQALKQAPQRWSIEGSFDTQLSLTLPLAEKDKTLPSTKIEVITVAKNSKFAIPSQQIDITLVDGTLRYSSQTGLKADNVQAQFLNHPAMISIGSELLKGKNRITYVHCKGHTDFASFSTFIPNNFNAFIQGDIDYAIRLGLPEEGNYFVELKSNLKGLKVDIPDFFGKKKEKEQPFYLLATPLKNDKLNLYIEYGKLLHTTLGMQNKQLKFGTVAFNSHHNTNTIFEKGITFSGSIDEININHWRDWLEKHHLLTASSFHLALLAKNLVIHNIKFKDYATGKINLNSEIKDNDIVSFFDSEKAKGFITQNKNQPLSLVLNELNLPDNIIQKTTEFHLKKHQSNSINPLMFPAIQFSAKQINIGATPYGSIHFNLEPQKHGLILRQMNILLGGLHLDGTLTWTVTENNRQLSSFDGTLKTENLNNVFKKWHYTNSSFNAKFGKVTLHASWKSNPFNFDLDKLTGNASFLLKNGRITGTSQVDKLHIFGLLNIDTITKRLRLDFSDFFDSGISFDKIKGAVSFDTGMLNLDSPVVIDGPSSNFTLNGTINMPEWYADLNMVVSLPIAQNLPTISLLLGQPALAGAIYLFDKLVGKKIMKFSSLRYNIEGPIDNPAVTVDKVFANKFKKNKSTSPNKQAAH